MKRHVPTYAAILAVCLTVSATSAIAQEAVSTTETTTVTATEEKKPLFALRDRLNFGGGAGVGLYDQFKDETFAYRIQAWWEIIPWFAVEAEWLDLGQSEKDGFKAKIDGFNLSAMPRVPFGDFAIFAKVGVYIWDGDQDAKGGGEQDLSFGAGMTYKIPGWPIGIRAEWTRCYVSNDDVFLQTTPNKEELDETIDVVTLGGYFHW